MTSPPSSSPLAHFSFPRTGKRGVPQQFPRRLYEMLDGETNHAESNSHYPKIIAWSNSGKAFRIYHVGEFSSTVLPKYFRTKKFSSFQRNLNLVSKKWDFVFMYIGV
jgi:HSF-type DNA-binding